MRRLAGQAGQSVVKETLKEMDINVLATRFPNIFDEINSYLTFNDIKACLEVSKEWFEAYSNCKSVQKQVTNVILEHISPILSKEAAKDWNNVFLELNYESRSRFLVATIDFFEKETYKKPYGDVTISYVALQSKDAELFKEILSISCMEIGSTLLHAAALDGNIEACKVLIPKLKDLITHGYKGETPIHIAVKSRNVPLVELFMTVDWDKNPPNQFGNTPLHEAAMYGYHEIYEIIMHQVQDKNPKGQLDITALHLAAEFGHHSIVELILNNVENKSPICLRDLTPLHNAAEHGHLSIVDLLLTNVKDKNPKSETSSLTPLHLACLGGHRSIVKSILEACQDTKDQNPIEDICSQTPLHFAVQNGHQDIVELLIKAQVPNMNSSKSNGWNALHIAAKKGFASIYKLLVQQSKEKNPALPNGLTPLHLAALEGHNEMLQLLVSLVKNIFPQSYQTKRTPFDCALLNRNTDACHILFETVRGVRDPLLDERYLKLQ